MSSPPTIRLGKLSEFREQRENANKHTPRGMGLLDDAMAEDGYVAPMTATADGEVIDGSARLETAAVAFPDEAIIVEHDGTRPIVMERSDIPNAADLRAKRISLRANRIAQLNLDFDPAIVQEWGEEFDLTPLWNKEEFSTVLADWGGGDNGSSVEDVEPQIDKAEELREKWGVETGQLWQLGEHRLLCGDSTKREDVERVMGGEKADIVFTDPPYNIASENEIFAANVSKSMLSLKHADWDKNFDLTPVLIQILRVLADDVTVYICTSHHLAPIVWKWMGEWSAHHEWCAWEKPNPMPSLAKRHWTWNAELVAYATRGKHTFNFPLEGHAPSIWRFNKHKETDHPTEKPVEVVVHAISHSSSSGDVLYDPFSGSGTTIVACEQLNRKCRAIEISPGYVAVTLQRWVDATGKQLTYKNT